MKEFQRKNVTSKFTTIRLTVSGERFEILVDPDNALKFKQGEITDHNKAIAFDEIYEDANKGTRISENKLKKQVGTGKQVSLGEEIFKVVNTKDLSLQGIDFAGGSRAQATDAINKLVKSNPSLKGKVMMVPEYELQD